MSDSSPTGRPGTPLPTRWKVAPADDQLRRRYVEAGFDDRYWDETTVPGPGNPAASEGPLLHRARFSTTNLTPGERVWLVFDGVDEQSDVWLDSGYLGDTEGAFQPHCFEITEAAAERPEHELATEVTSSMGHGALWAPVRLERSGPVRLVRHRIVCLDADVERATLRIVVDANSVDDRDVVLRTRVAGHEHSIDQHLASGSNRIEWLVHVAAPELWWPHSLGAQPLHEVSVEVLLEDETTSDAVARTVGLRSVRMRDWIWSINGERCFLKGASFRPSPRGDTGHDTGHDAIEAARGIGLDLVRIEERVSRLATYERADELGVVVWQDLPSVAHRGRSARASAQRQTVAAVDLLGHHPSIVGWHASPPSLLDRVRGRSPRRVDSSRPVVTETATLPPWARADASRLGLLAAAVPRWVRFPECPGEPDPEDTRRAAQLVRLLKYRPAGGIDLGPLEPLDDARRAVLADVCQPLLPVLDEPPEHVHAGDVVALGAFVVSDEHRALDGAELDVLASWAGGTQHMGWTGDLPPDSVIRAGTFEMVAPELDGVVEIAATVRAGERHVRRTVSMLVRGGRHG